MEKAYSEDEQPEMKMTISVLKTYIESLQVETRIAINRFDAYMAEGKRA